MLRIIQGPILQAQAGIRAPILQEWDTWWTVNMQPQPPWCKQGRLANQDTITHIQQRPTRNTTDICSPGNSDSFLISFSISKYRFYYRAYS